MPLLWRYLLREFFQVFFLSVSGFISTLLVTRFQSIARFAASGASKLYTLKFILFQIPFILPLAIPISCLIAGFVVFQRMSRSHEITALRVAGLSLSPILFPIMSVGLILALFNFTVVSELAPKCKAKTKSLAYEMAAINPLCLLQKETVIKLKNTYIDMKLLKSGKYAEDVVFVMRNPSNGRLGMMLAKKVSLKNEKLKGKDVTFISSINPKNPESFDHLVIENQGEMVTEANHLSQYLRKGDWNLGFDYLNMRELEAKRAIEKKEFTNLSSKAVQEIGKRFSLAFAAFTFTLVGLAFGIEISRTRKWKGVLWATILMTFYLVAFVTGKSIKHDPLPSLICFLAPHPIILLTCLFAFKRILKGAE